MSESNLSGSLWLVATPIGNLSDFSPRGKEVLSRVDQVACEDTRVTKKLLNSLSLEVPLISYREENERKKSIELADLIEGGKKIALLSDAGYPAISDPGFRLVRECRKRGLSVNPIPGANAALTALACSGLPTHQFLYLGFLPKKSVRAEKLLKKWENFEGSIILYESKYRIEKIAYFNSLFSAFFSRRRGKASNSIFRSFASNISRSDVSKCIDNTCATIQLSR